MQTEKHGSFVHRGCEKWLPSKVAEGGSALRVPRAQALASSSAAVDTAVWRSGKCHRAARDGHPSFMSLCDVCRDNDFTHRRVLCGGVGSPSHQVGSPAFSKSSLWPPACRFPQRLSVVGQ